MVETSAFTMESNCDTNSVEDISDDIDIASIASIVSINDLEEGSTADITIDTSCNVTVTDFIVEHTLTKGDCTDTVNPVVEEILVSEGAYRQIKSRTSSRLAEGISNDLSQLPVTKEQEIDIVIQALKKMGIYEKITQIKLKMSLQKKGRPMTPLITRNKVWQFWHDKSIISTAKLRIANRYLLPLCCYMFLDIHSKFSSVFKVQLLMIQKILIYHR